VLLAVTPDYTANSVTARLIFDGPVSGKYVNFAADFDGDGTLASGEWVVQNAVLGGAGNRWRFSAAFPLPVGTDNKFPGQFWTRVRVSSDPLPTSAGWDGACDGATCSDQLTIIDTLDGPSQSPGQAALGPRSLPKALEIDTSDILPAKCKTTCAKDNITFDVPCRALVINFGDRPGNGETVIQNDASAAKALFTKRFGKDNVETVSGNRAQITATLKSFVSQLTCMGQAHIYFAGHGCSKEMLEGKYESGIYVAQNVGGWDKVMTSDEIHAAITSAAHCPSPMNYYSTAKCGGAGYCNLSVYMMNCYSGGFLNGDASLGMPGLNVLTLTDDTIPGAGNQNWGTAVGKAFVDAFRGDQADADQDGETTTDEAMKWAREHYDGVGNVTGRPAPGQKMTQMYDTNPQQKSGADCKCSCTKNCFDEPGSEAAKAIESLLSMNGPVCEQDIIDTITYSSSLQAPKPVAHDHTTINKHVTDKPTWDAAHVTQLYNNTDFPCGTGVNGTTLCPQPLQTVPAGDFVVVFMQLEKPIPLADPTNYYQYAFVFDADGVAANNYQPPAAYPNDFFKDSDRWYEIDYTPSAGWTVKVSKIVNNAPQTDISAARITILDNVIVLVVPASEFGVPKPSFRLTAFRHTGDYGANPPYDWDGSVWPDVATGLASFP